MSFHEHEMNLPVNDCGQKALTLLDETDRDFYLESCAPGKGNKVILAKMSAKKVF